MSDDQTTTPADFDLDAWIDGATRPSEVVRIYGKGHLNEELRELERQIDRVKRTPAAERSIADEGETLDSLEARWEQVATELLASELQLHVHALTSDEISDARDEAKRAKVSDAESVLFVVAKGVSRPQVTPKQLARLARAAGEAGVTEAFQTIMRLSHQNVQVQPSVPFSPKPSGGRQQ